MTLLDCSPQPCALGSQHEGPGSYKNPTRHDREKQTDNSTQHKTPTESQDCNAFERTRQRARAALRGALWRPVSMTSHGRRLLCHWSLRILARRISPSSISAPCDILI